MSPTSSQIPETHTSMETHRNQWSCVSGDTHTHTRMHARSHACTYARMHVRTHACMYARTRKTPASGGKHEHLHTRVLSTSGKTHPPSPHSASHCLPLTDRSTRSASTACHSPTAAHAVPPGGRRRRSPAGRQPTGPPGPQAGEARSPPAQRSERGEEGRGVWGEGRGNGIKGRRG